MLSKQEKQLLTDILNELKEIKTVHIAVARPVSGFTLDNKPDLIMGGIQLAEPIIDNMKIRKTEHEGEIKLALNFIGDELKRANKIHGGFTSFHEGSAVLREEYLELEQEIFKKDRDMGAIIEEATQVGAMAVKIILLAKAIQDGKID